MSPDRAASLRRSATSRLTLHPTDPPYDPSVSRSVSRYTRLVASFPRYASRYACGSLTRRKEWRETRPTRDAPLRSVPPHDAGRFATPFVVPQPYPTPSAPLTHTGAGERAPGRYTLHNIRPVGATLTRPFAGPPAEPGHERRFVLRSSSLPPLPVSFTSFGSRLGATLRYAPPRSPPSAVGDRPAARRNEW